MGIAQIGVRSKNVECMTSNLPKCIMYNEHLSTLQTPLARLVLRTHAG
jgi:hypothetical protein